MEGKNDLTYKVLGINLLTIIETLIMIYINKKTAQ